MSWISARDVHIEFPIYDAYARSLKHTLGLGRIARGINRIASRNLDVGGQIGKGETGRIVVKALDGVSFDVHAGDRVGILGRNGSGKTTMMRCLAGIYEPIKGTVEANGRVIPLFDVGLGMDPDATGEENIWLRGRMLDLTPEQIKSSFDDVAEFTQLGDYLHMPIRTYSAGMLTRLGFGISTAVTPDILILDEMIGAGDTGFFERANQRLKSLVARSGILIVASHSTTVLKGWCNKGMILDRGKLVAQGSVEEVIRVYDDLSGVRPGAVRAAEQTPGEGSRTEEAIG